jgi:outer membrane immunogenic protein
MTRTLLLASATLGAVLLPLGAASAAGPFDWNGFYAGIHGGWLNGDVNVHEEYSVPAGGSISGGVLGVLAGYNFFYPPAGPLVLGIEADAGWADVHGSGIAQPPDPDCAVDYLYDLNWDAHFRVRASFPTGGVTPFIAGGLAVADLNVSQVCEGREQIGGLFFGGTIGAGLDLNAGNVVVRGEVLYDVYGRKQYEDYSADFSAWTARAALIWHLQ